MSDEQRKDEETEVEAHHLRRFGNEEPSDEGSEDEVEAHVRRATMRKDTMRKD
jgi:hypothetical protein